MYKCGKWDKGKYCNRNATPGVYCKEHFDELDKLKILNTLKLSNRNHLLLVIFLLPLTLGLLFFSWSYSNKIDEDAICKDKVTKHFPEYSFDKIRYYGNNECRGIYSAEKDVETRDGLKKIGGAETIPQIIRFEFIDKMDKINVAKDDWTFITVLISVITGMGLFATIMDWKRNERWWI